MSLRDKSARGPGVASVEGVSLGAMLLGVVSATGASAQEATSPEVAPLPPVEVTAQPSPKKKKKAIKKQAPAEAYEPAPEPVEAVAAPPVGSRGDGSGTGPIVPSSGNILTSGTGVSRLPSTIKETPKTVNVVSRQLIEQQQATTLEQALKNVPGITLSTGEGNGGQNGDQFRIRGLTSKGDVYIDGLRDFGVYTRDSFNTESVQVIKGPSGESFGVGNLGGLINQSTKKAHLGNVTHVDQAFGSGPTYRTTLDANYQIDPTTAVRINGLFHNQDVEDRDHVESDRWGGAIDLGFGLGTPTQWHLNYSYLHGDKTPDYGVPMVQGPDGIFRPLTEYSIPGGNDRSRSYVRSTDRDVTDVHVLTSTFSSKLNENVTISNDTRLSFYDRDFSSTNPSACSGACATAILGGIDRPLSYGAGGGMTYLQDGWAFQNVVSAKLDFTTAGMKHKAVVGVDTIYQEDSRNLGSWGSPTTRPSDQTILNPYHYVPGAMVTYGASTRDANATDIGVFAMDRWWLTNQFSLQGGLRWDYFESEYEISTGAFGGSAVAKEWSPSISAIWEPTKEYTAYASYSRTYRPVGTDIAAAVGGVGSEVPRDDRDNNPERADVYEVGVKADLFGGNLGLTGAIFQIDKDNSFTVDEFGNVEQAFSDNGQGRRIRGVELGVTGKLTDYWTAYLAYAYLDGEVTFASDPLLIGNNAPGVAHNNFSFWTTYDLPQSVTTLPGVVTLGGGFQYASDYWADSANTALIPDTFSLDTMISYKTDDYRISLNGYNLTDHLNYSSSFNSVRAVPISGRTFMLNIGATF